MCPLTIGSTGGPLNHLEEINTSTFDLTSKNLSICIMSIATTFYVYLSFYICEEKCKLQVSHKFVNIAFGKQIVVSAVRSKMLQINIAAWRGSPLPPGMST